MTLRYISTRGLPTPKRSSGFAQAGSAPALSFEDVVLAGLASDGGLYVPDAIPAFSLPEIAAMQALSYPELAFAIISRFTEGSIAPEVLERIIGESYKGFRHAAIAPLKQLDAHTFLLELFHGPTLAFKDFALQFLGRLLDHILEKRGAKAVIVGATSGDTGSAAIEGCRGRSNMEIFILHPKGRVSDVQRRQMTTVLDNNVHNIAIEGTFDDCQDIVKALFQSYSPSPCGRGLGGGGTINALTGGEIPPSPPLPHKGGGRSLVAVNSINWARIVAQIPYYFYAALALGAPVRAVNFAVPTGNFGDIYAGYMAKKMGLPIGQLTIATNRNDILTRALNGGTYSMETVVPSLSPSMDIQISSNFERLLFDVHGRDGGMIHAMMASFRKDKKLTLSPAVWAKLKAEFSACAISDDDTKKTIAETYAATGELLDPHSAVGLAAGQCCRRDTAEPLVVLATAHPAKFPDAVKAATGLHPALPKHLADLLGKQERFDVLANDADKVKAFINEKI